MPLVIRSDSDAAEQIYEMNRRRHRDKFDKPDDCLPRIRAYGLIPCVRKCSSVIERIPRNQWSKLIKAGAGNWLSDLRKGKIEPHNQGSTPLCWAHGSVRAVEVLRVYEGQAPLLLSAEALVYEITGGRMRGGSPDEALGALSAYGTCDQSLWPHNTLNVREADESWKTNRERHIILDWLDIENFDDQMTLALKRIPVAIGLGWWGHCVCQLDPIDFEDGSFGIGFDNSWGSSFGDNGYGILHESKATADLGAFAPISETFSVN